MWPYGGVLVRPVEKIVHGSSSARRLKNIIRRELELKWIKPLQTPFPLGFDVGICRGRGGGGGGRVRGSVSGVPDFGVFSLLGVKKRNGRSHGGCLERAAVCDCGTPLTFLLPFVLPKFRFNKVCLLMAVFEISEINKDFFFLITLPTKTNMRGSEVVTGDYK